MEIAGVIFVLVLVAIAYIAFRLLKRSVRFFVRLILLIVIIGAALVGGIYIWNYSGVGGTGVPVRVR